jgi:hypothetical protein
MLWRVMFRARLSKSDIYDASCPSATVHVTWRCLHARAWTRLQPLVLTQAITRVRTSSPSTTAHNGRPAKEAKGTSHPTTDTRSADFWHKAGSPNPSGASRKRMRELSAATTTNSGPGNGKTLSANADCLFRLKVCISRLATMWPPVLKTQASRTGIGTHMLPRELPGPKQEHANVGEEAPAADGAVDEPEDDHVGSSSIHGRPTNNVKPVSEAFVPR